MIRKLLFITICLLATAVSGFAQVNVALLHQLVNNSETEFDGQTKARNGQAANTANEEVNRSKMTTLKSVYRDIHSRFQTLGLVINTAQIGIEAVPITNEIIRLQKLIIEQCRDNPALIAMALNSESDLVDQAELLVNYCVGLILSIGDINQMKASDRKILFSHVVTELRTINGASRGLLTAITNYQIRIKNNQNNPFADFINRDKQLVDEIMRNANVLKQ